MNENYTYVQDSIKQLDDGHFMHIFLGKSQEKTKQQAIEENDYEVVIWVEDKK